MRIGDFAVQVVADGAGHVVERETGHVLARSGQIYRLRLRNFGPLYCVVDVDIDGRRVTAGGLVLEPWGTTDLERPIDAGEDGCFTVIAEGNESAFGPDGGRDNDALGLIEARFRRELPRHDRAEMPPAVPLPSSRVPSRISPLVPRTPIYNSYRDVDPMIFSEVREDSIERAAGTGLTGHSDQRFMPIHLGPLESEATVIRLRLVIGTEDALEAETVRPLVERTAPARPAPRP